MPEWLTMIVVAVVAASSTWVTTWATRRTHIESRIDQVQEENRSYRNENRALWLYTKELIDHIYKGKPPPPPEPPSVVVDLEVHK